ncbi:MAG: hypothetical protein ABII25_10375 [bacterium]
MANEIEKKDLAVLLKESWEFFTKRWAILFQVTLFVWIPILMIAPLAGFLWTSYNNLLKNNPELLFSFKVILSGGVLVFTIVGILVAVLLIDRLIKVTIMDSLWEKPEEKYCLNIFKLLKEVWPKMGGLYKTQILAWFIIFLWSLLFFVPGVFFFILFSFVPYEVILKGKMGNDALVSSKKIVRCNLGKFVGNMLVMVGILVFINIGLSGFFKLIFSSFHSMTLLNLGELAATIISNILGLWGTIFHFSLYKELERRSVIPSGVGATLCGRPM